MTDVLMFLAGVTLGSLIMYVLIEIESRRRK